LLQGIVYDFPHLLYVILVLIFVSLFFCICIYICCWLMALVDRIIDEKGVVQYMNDAFTKLSGYAKNELYGKNINRIMTSEASPFSASSNL